ncbi:Killing trait [Caulobacter sp. AP07]|uniref:RebB family R body protein n=1 Tax=Caulobacter sp. AP07 TaxID=1144304 RepID=UPI0002722038|nr:RebB family R body protein [Caulobacter sp. AP07]EJL33255.1 Killing trait [Caulobacter sp. AP07]
MAFPTTVNSQITDAVTQAGTQVLGSGPAFATAALYQATAQAMANAAHNATHAQQQGYIVAQAATALAVARLLGSAEHGVGGVNPADILASVYPPPAPSPSPAATAAAALAEGEAAISVLQAIAAGGGADAAQARENLQQLAAVAAAPAA